MGLRLDQFNKPGEASAAAVNFTFGVGFGRGAELLLSDGLGHAGSLQAGASRTIDRLCSVDLHPFLGAEKAHDTMLAALPNWADTDAVFSISQVKQLAV
jgi:hypothetical protein